MNDNRFKIIKSDYAQQFELWWIINGAEVKTLTLEDKPEGMMGSPCIEMPTRKAKPMFQSMIDGLWDAGFRPSNHRDFTNELEATKEHLEDMRKLTFKKEYVPIKGK